MAYRLKFNYFCILKHVKSVNPMKKTHYIRLSKLHILIIFGFSLHKCYLFFKNFILSNLNSKKFNQNNLKSSVKFFTQTPSLKGSHPRTLDSSQKRTTSFMSTNVKLRLRFDIHLEFT